MHQTAEIADQDAADREQIRRIAAGDRAAFEALYHRYAARLGGYLWRRLHRHDLVEEALDDVMMVVWQRAERFDGRSRVSSWMLGIAHNKALKTLERVRRHEGSRRAELSAPSTRQDDEWSDVCAVMSKDHASHFVDPEESLLQRDRIRDLGQAIESLTAEQRAVVELTFFEGRSYAEISEIVDCPVNTVKTRMFHARKHLSRRLGRNLHADA